MAKNNRIRIPLSALTLSLYDFAETFLLGAVNDESRSLGFLLRHLFRLHGGRVLRAERQL